MPYPTAPASFPRFDLSGPASNIDPAAFGFVALRLLPPIEAPNKFMRWWKYKLESWLKTASTIRAFNAGTPQIDMDLEEVSATLLEHSLKTAVDVNQQDAWGDNAYDEASRIRLAAQIVARSIEVRAAANLESNSIYSSNAKAITTDWTNTSASIPIDDVNDARAQVKAKTGMVCNFLRLHEAQIKYLATNAQLVGRYKGASTDIVSALGGTDREKRLADLFDIAEVVICGAVTNSADQGQTVTAADIWNSDKAGVGFKLATPGSHKEVQIGRHLMLTTEDLANIGTTARGAAEVEALNLYVDQYADPDTKSDNLRVTRTLVEKTWEEKCYCPMTGCLT